MFCGFRVRAGADEDASDLHLAGVGRVVEWGELPARVLVARVRRVDLGALVQQELGHAGMALDGRPVQGRAAIGVARENDLLVCRDQGADAVQVAAPGGLVDRIGRG